MDVTDKSEPDQALMLKTAFEAADLAGAAILPHFRVPVSIQNKAAGEAFDPVTIADRDAEHVIRNHVEKQWPDHGLIGEEFANVRPDAPIKWIIDPIDGTRSFIIGSPMWGTLIGITLNDVPILGLMDQPFTSERFYASANGAFWRGPSTVRASGQDTPRRLNVRPCNVLKDAVLTTTHPDHIERSADLQRFFDLKSRVRLSRYGGDCYSYGLLAAGLIDLIVETGLNSYDIAALIPIVEKAGGIITTWEGEPAIHGGRIIAAGDPTLHEAAMKVLTG